MKASLSFLIVGLITLPRCSPVPAESVADYAPYLDTTVVVYGPYAAVKLPLGGVAVANPIQLASGPDSLLYACNQTGEVYSLRDTDGDGLEDLALLYCNVSEFGLRSPAGFAHRGDTIYIGTAQQIRAFLDRNGDGAADTSWVFFDDIPQSEHPYEWTSALTFGPDGWLYCALTTDSWNAAPSPDPRGFRGAIVRISPDGRVAERVATGIRSVNDMTFHESGDLLFIDNEGGGNPTEELNLVVPSAFYGHNPKKYTHDSVTPPVYSFRTEIAPAAIEFNHGNAPDGTQGNLFVAFYGAGERWNRGAIARLVVQRSDDGHYTFEEIPVADIPKLSAMAFGRDGGLYVAHHGETDYWYNAIYENQGSIYKLVHDEQRTGTPLDTRVTSPPPADDHAIATGKRLFAELACLGCHAIDGTTDRIGPNLHDIGNRLSRQEILEEITAPSARVTPSMMGVRVVRTNGQVLLGRIVSSDQSQIALMVIGNQIVSIPRTEIASTENMKESLMYTGLLDGVSLEDREALLTFMENLTRQ